MNINCPNCQNVFPLEAGTEDLCARQFFGLMGKRPALAGALVAYLGLFKPRVQALRWSRALTLAQDALALCDNDARLNRALVDTVESLRDRRLQANWQPLTKHNYLIRVLENTPAEIAPAAPAGTGAGGGQSKTATAIQAVRDYRCWIDGVEDHWFVRALREAFERLFVLRLDGAPAHDMVRPTLDHWIKTLWLKREWSEHHRMHGAERLKFAIQKQATDRKRWPQPEEILAEVPKV